MNIKCFMRGHWWTADHQYDVPTIQGDPRSDIEAVTTYARRECLRCAKQDSITISDCIFDGAAGLSPKEQAEAYMAVTGTAGVGKGCDAPFWLEQDAIEYTRLFGGYVRPLFGKNCSDGSALKSRSVISDQNAGMNAANGPSEDNSTAAPATLIEQSGAEETHRTKHKSTQNI